MVAGVIKFNLKLETLDEAIDYWNALIDKSKKEIPLLRDNLRGCLFLVDRKTGHGYTLGLWEKAEDSKAFEESPYFPQMMAELGRYCLKPPTRDRYDIVGGSIDFARLDLLAA